ncbi:MAG TPA: RIP metalloprotease RseP [Bryobacteraceae bacterium]|jgi:regulator of sigma E protease
MAFLQSFFWFLVLIGVMILIHELGHFWAARLFDVRVDVFSIGFGPRLFGFRRGDTDYRFSAILFGGYVKMAGEQLGEEHSDDPNGLLSKPRWQRLIIAFAGPFMNMALAVGLLTGLFMVKYQKPADEDKGAMIGYVVPGSAAEKAGIKAGDKIIRIEGKADPTWEDINMKEVASSELPMDVTILRDGKTQELKVTPKQDERNGVGTAGWAPKSEIELVSIAPGMPAEKAGLHKGDLIISANNQPIESRYTLPAIVRGTSGKAVDIVFKRDNETRNVTIQPEWNKADGEARWVIGVGIEEKLNFITTKLSFPDALAESLRENERGATMIVDFLKGLVERRMSAKSLAGPIQIGQMSGIAAKQGPASFIDLMSMVSLNLAIFNLLPIPILDGGVILLLLIEILMGRELSLSFKETMLKIGFVFLMMVVVFVLYNDITNHLLRG